MLLAPWSRGLLLLGLLLLGNPNAGQGIRIEGERGDAPSFLQRQEVVATTTAAPDLAALMTRMATIQGVVKTLDAKVSSLEEDASKVEAQMSTTGVNLAKSMGSLAKIKADSSANAKVAQRLANQSKVLEAKSLKSMAEMDTLMKEVNTLEMNAKMMGKGSTQLGEKITQLEGTVKDALPGVGGISTKMDKVEKDIKSFQEQLKKGIEEQVGVELKAMLNSVRGEVRGLAKELEKRKLKENE